MGGQKKKKEEKKKKERKSPNNFIEIYQWLFWVINYHTYNHHSMRNEFREFKLTYYIFSYPPIIFSTFSLIGFIWKTTNRNAGINAPFEATIQSESTKFIHSLILIG